MLLVLAPMVQLLLAQTTSHLLLLAVLVLQALLVLLDLLE
jgi:hypothetical protein